MLIWRREKARERKIGLLCKVGFLVGPAWREKKQERNETVRVSRTAKHPEDTIQEVK